MKMKSIYSLWLIVAVVALLLTSVPVQASVIDDRIESSAQKSYVFTTYLQGDDIKVQSKDGVVTLTGTVPKNPTNHWPKKPLRPARRGKRRQQAGSQR